jgi:hypothetical protein
VQLGVFDVAHALVVADDQGQEGGDHGPAVRDVAIEQVQGIGDLHQAVPPADVLDGIDQGVHATGEVVGGDHGHVGPGGGFGREMGRRPDPVVPALGFMT